MVAFALLMTPFATNPLIYVASDPNYRRRPQIDIAPISSTEASSSIKQNCRKAFVQDEKNISGLIEIVFASLCEETPWQRLVLNYFLFNIFAFYVQSYHAQGWTTPTALRSVRHSVVELVHPALSIVTTTKVHHQALSPDTTSSSSRTHTTYCSSV